MLLICCCTREVTVLAAVAGHCASQLIEMKTCWCCGYCLAGGCSVGGCRSTEEQAGAVLIGQSRLHRGNTVAGTMARCYGRPGKKRSIEKKRRKGKRKKQEEERK
jgi:hypothetical protein